MKKEFITLAKGIRINKNERYGIRTHVTTLEGWYANHYTNLPIYGKKIFTFLHNLLKHWLIRAPSIFCGSIVLLILCKQYIKWPNPYHVDCPIIFLFTYCLYLCISFVLTLDQNKNIAS